MNYKEKIIEERLQKLYGNSYDNEVKNNIYFYGANLRRKVLKWTLYSFMFIAFAFIVFISLESLAVSYQRSRYTKEEWYFVENCDYFDSDIKFYAETKEGQYFTVYKGINKDDNKKYKSVYFYSLTEIKSNDIKMYVNGKEYNISHKYGILNVSDGKVDITLYIDDEKYNFIIIF